MKILHIINSLHTGGAEKLISETLPLFQKEGLDVSLALLNGSCTPFYEELKNNSSIRIYNLGMGTVYNPTVILKIIPLLKKIDVIHVHLFPSLYFVALASWISKSKSSLVFTEHSTDNKRLQNKFLSTVDRAIYSRYNKIICITPQVKSVLKHKLSIRDKKLEVIENGINIKKIQGAQKADRYVFNYCDSDKILIMVAGFREQKDHETVIRAIKLLPAEYKLLLVGDGVRRTTIEEYISSLQLNDRVKLLGVRTDVYSLIKMSDFSVLSSHWEGFGLAAAEAMACGVPTIASNVDGLSSVVENGGILFEKGNIDDLKNKILMLENDEVYKHYSKLGIEKAKQYDIKLMINKLQDLYKVL